jgi:AcrR family transcriptional regulator
MSTAQLEHTDLSAIPGVRVPRQQRSRERLERMLDAAEDLIAADGIRATSMAAVARAAGTSIGAIYARFDNKRALIHAVHARFLARTATLAEAAADPARWAGRSLDEVLEGMIPVAVMAIRGNAGLIRAFLLAAFEDEAMRDRAQAATRRGTKAVIHLIMERRNEVRRPDPEVAADFAMRFVMATAQHSLIFERPTPRRYGDEELARRLVDAVTAYLGGGELARTP